MPAYFGACMKDSERRELGRQYHKDVFDCTYNRYGKNATLNELRSTVSRIGNFDHIFNDERFYIKLAITNYRRQDDEQIAKSVLYPEEVQKIKPYLKHELFDLIHSVTHVATDTIHNPEGELAIIGATGGFIGKLGEVLVAEYFIRLHSQSASKKRLYGFNAEEFDSQGIQGMLKRGQTGILSKYYCIDVDTDIPPIKENVLPNEFAITPLNFLEATARGRFARQKVITNSEHGEDIFYSRIIDLITVPAKAIYTTEAERELAWRIAQDKPIPNSRLPFTTVQIKEVKELVAYNRHEIAKFQG